MQSTLTKDRLLQMRGQPVYGANHEKLGGIQEIYLDKDTQEPEWIGLSSGLFGNKHTVVPLEEATVEGDGITVPYAKDLLQKTPDIQGNEIDEETEAELYRCYGLNYSKRPSSSGLPEGGGRGQGAPSAKSGGDTMTRSEEELRIGKRETDAGQVRLRKFVETEPVTENVQLRQETASIERTPVNKPVGDVEIGEQEITADLRGEEPVVEKRAVAKEEVRLRKGSETRDEQVSESVRKERIETEGDTKTKPQGGNKQF